MRKVRKRRRPAERRPRFRIYKETPNRIDVHTVTYTGVMIDAVAFTMADGTEVSNGYIFLDEIDDIFILKAAIDNFIQRHKLIPPVR